MTDNLPIACTLGAEDLRRRLETIATLGAEALRSRSAEGDVGVLRFHPDPTIRRRLEEIIAAESACCAFLDLRLTDEDGDLVLRITAPKDGMPVADELALAFGDPG